MPRLKHGKRRNRPFWDNKKRQAQQKDPDTWSTDSETYVFWCKGCGRLCGWGFEIEKTLIEEWEADGELCTACLEKRDKEEPKVVDPQYHDNMEDALFNG